VLPDSWDRYLSRAWIAGPARVSPE
jgi:hypothetical protein